jgi:hypothetical protein
MVFGDKHIAIPDGLVANEFVIRPLPAICRPNGDPEGA